MHLVSAVVALKQPVFMLRLQITIAEIEQWHTATYTEVTLMVSSKVALQLLLTHTRDALHQLKQSRDHNHDHFVGDMLSCC